MLASIDYAGIAAIIVALGTAIPAIMGAVRSGRAHKEAKLGRQQAQANAQTMDVLMQKTDANLQLAATAATQLTQHYDRVEKSYQAFAAILAEQAKGKVSDGTPTP